ncbi:hypothetical protein PIB30_094446 [Stylosanthes scabra]|uniref:Uncharacterized protein n=1 Tax=Stylosanthes scabra TaxID=79078 RepID=A0ABU6RVZ3_9FABA|nr:hypothetical protein [Stylosanthes scabra]
MIISSTLLSFGVLVSILVYVMQRQMKQNQEASATSNHHNRNIELSSFFVYISTITSATNNFSTNNILGKCGFGSVYKCGVRCFVCVSFHVCILRQRQNFTVFSNSTH